MVHYCQIVHNVAIPYHQFNCSFLWEVFALDEFHYSKMTSLYITVSAVLPTSSSKDSNICGAPILEFTEESCKNGMGFDQFQVQSSKKINWKKPLNGKIRLKFGGNSGKSDALRLKKCVKVLSSFTQDLIELTAYFQENVPRNEATLLYANETTVLLQLRNGGIYNQNILACF